MEYPGADYTGYPKRLFNWLKPDPSKSFMSLDDFDIRAYNALVRGDLKMMTESADKVHVSPLALSFVQRQEASRTQQWSAFLGKAMREGLVDEAEKREGRGLGGVNAKEDLLRLLKMRYGGIGQGWRRGLDTNRDGRLTFAQFCKAVRLIGFNGCIKELWELLLQSRTDGTMAVTLEELDPEADKVLKRFKELLLKVHGNLL